MILLLFLGVFMMFIGVLLYPRRERPTLDWDSLTPPTSGKRKTPRGRLC
jgi:hypothetical protein